MARRPNASRPNIKSKATRDLTLLLVKNTLGRSGGATPLQRRDAKGGAKPQLDTQTVAHNGLLCM